MLNVLFIGLGSIGQRHLRNLKALLGDRVKFTAFRTRRTNFILSDQLTIESDQGLEEKYDLQVFTELEPALASRPDIAFVTNPTSLHIPVALAAAEAGAHLFIEKPLSNNMEGIVELIRLVERKNLVACVGYQMRFHPGLQQIGDWVNSGSIGRILAVQAEVAEYLPRFHAYEDYRQTYAASHDLGGGVVLSQIHELDYLCSLFGMPRRVFSLGGKLSDLEIDVEDLASTLLEFRHPDGSLLPVHLHQDYLQRPGSRSCLLIGERGKVMWDYHSGMLQQFDSQGNSAALLDFSKHQRNQLFLDELKHFLDSLDGKHPPMVSLRDGVKSLMIAEAILESLKTGQPVTIRN